MVNEAVVIAFNHGCNCNCLMCPNTPAYRKQTDMDIDEIKEDLLKKINPDTKHITITGGEPTLRNDLLDILEMINNKWPNITMRLLSNGRFFYYNSYLNSFLDKGIKNLEFGIPICGSNPKIHDKITQAEGSFKQTIGGVKNLLNAKQLVELRIVINKLNIDDLYNMSKLIKKELNSILRVTYYYMQITGNAQINKDKVYVSYDEINEKINPTLENLKQFEIGLCHFPLCTLDSKWWPYAWKTVKDYKLFFPEKCNSCLYKKYCLGIHRSYKAKFGLDEFNPVRKKYKIIESDNPTQPIKRVIL
ncbi:MAG: 7-carboxy-7-deazaguanine synthase [Candidatus Woesearchaeota archaeon]|nr:7-carboxy-7-deazaguanine synthase [Candidatus Woesearchaeota archaeon]